MEKTGIETSCIVNKPKNIQTWEINTREKQ